MTIRPPRHIPPGPPPALWLCLHLPALPLEALGPWPVGIALPVLVWERDPRGARGVVAASALARQRGVQTGQALATAQALVPDALVLDRRPEREAQALHRLALRLGALTPHLVVAPPDVLLEVHTCLRLFGGVRALRHRALAHAREAGLTPLSALAPTPLGARLLVRAGDRTPRHTLQTHTFQRRLRPLPLSALPTVMRATDTRTATLDMLQALGLHTLHDLARLPTAGLRRRGVGPWLDTLARAEGRQPDPPAWFTPPLTFHQRLELPHPAEHLPLILSAAAHLLHALCGWLHLHWQAAQQLELILHHEQGARRHLPPETVVLDLSQPSRDAAHLGTVLDEHLQRHPLTAAIDALELRLCASVPDHGQALSLLPGAPDEDTTAQASLIDRLVARLGHEQVLRLQPQADARPEKADRAVCAQERPPLSPSPPPPSTHRVRPTWLLEPPLALPLLNDHPCFKGQPLQLLTRAERIESGWHDGGLVRRDYHVALASDGSLHWVYQTPAHRDTVPPTPAEPPTRWFLHGHFS